MNEKLFALNARCVSDNDADRTRHFQYGTNDSWHFRVVKQRRTCLHAIVSIKEHFLELLKTTGLLLCVLSKLFASLMRTFFRTTVRCTASYFVKIMWCSLCFVTPPHLRLCIALFAIVEGWLLVRVSLLNKPLLKLDYNTLPEKAEL